jgi:hypothetical protein
LLNFSINIEGLMIVAPEHFLICQLSDIDVALSSIIRTVPDSGKSHVMRKSRERFGPLAGLLAMDKSSVPARGLNWSRNGCVDC